MKETAIVGIKEIRNWLYNKDFQNYHWSYIMEEWSIILYNKNKLLAKMLNSHNKGIYFNYSLFSVLYFCTCQPLTLEPRRNN